MVVEIVVVESAIAGIACNIKRHSRLPMLKPPLQAKLCIPEPHERPVEGRC